MVFSESTVDCEISVVNNGEVETWPRIRINGPGTDPVIENTTTGKSISLTYTLASGDYIDIDMNQATVTLNGSMNIISSISESSTFWPLLPGENTLHVMMQNVTTGSVVIYWYDRYQSGL